MALVEPLILFSILSISLLIQPWIILPMAKREMEEATRTMRSSFMDCAKIEREDIIVFFNTW